MLRVDGINWFLVSDFNADPVFFSTPVYYSAGVLWVVSDERWGQQYSSGLFVFVIPC